MPCVLSVLMYLRMQAEQKVCPHSLGLTGAERKSEQMGQRKELSRDWSPLVRGVEVRGAEVQVY